jgi:hypothetical protein
MRGWKGRLAPALNTLKGMRLGFCSHGDGCVQGRAAEAEGFGSLRARIGLRVSTRAADSGLGGGRQLHAVFRLPCRGLLPGEVEV